MGERRARCRHCRRSSTRRNSPSSSASRPRRTARACPISWSARKASPAPAGALIHAYGGFRAAQTPDLSDRAALSLGPARPVLGRGRQCLCARQHPRRRRIWAGVAQGGAARKAPEQLRRSGGGRPRPHPHRRRAQGRGRDFRPLEWRRAGRRGDDPASRALFGGDRRLAARGHEALFAPARRRVVDR